LSLSSTGRIDSTVICFKWRHAGNQNSSLTVASAVVKGNGL
jgi:hypothetical protein